MGCSLHQHGHGHGGESSSHGHSHGETVSDAGKSDVNINVRAAYIHVLGDFIQSAGVFVAALIIYFKPEWQLADPICTFIFSILVLITTFSIMKEALLVSLNFYVDLLILY